MVKINHSPLGDRVYAIIWDQIISHKLGPGDKISDLRLSEELGVSRTPIREALHRLSQDGIVRSENRHGFFVATFSSQDVTEVYDIRTALEVLAVRLALPWITNADLDEAQGPLSDLRNELIANVEGAEDRWLASDRAFHRMLARKARNQRLEAMLNSLQTQISVFQVYGNHSSRLRLISLGHHQKILDALKERDCRAAELAMERHIQEVKEWVLAEFVSRELHPSPT